MGFPVGYHALHADASLNFQMNRWFGWVGEPQMLEEMRRAAGRIADYADWKREFLALARASARSGHVLRSGFYLRAAEFFMMPGDPDRGAARDGFLQAVRHVYGSDLGECHHVPYVEQGRAATLPAYRLAPALPRATVVFFGGFDSYIEELAAAFIFLREAGYEVIAFDGPGQGGALESGGLRLTAQWHRPVAAVLDHFGCADVALVGLSLGGCLALRAAARESRVRYVVAYDVLTDLLEVNLRQTGRASRAILRLLLRAGQDRIVNGLVNRLQRGSPVVQWGVAQGMHITGAHSPSAFLRSIAELCTTDISHDVRQDVLLLAGSEDHYVPLGQWHQQIAALRHARSITAHLFTAAQDAQNHCQVGNYGLALRTIANWLDVTTGCRE